MGFPPGLLSLLFTNQREYDPFTAPSTRGDSIDSQALKPEATLAN